MKPIKASEIKIGDIILVSWNGAGPVEAVKVIRVEPVEPTSTWIEIKYEGNRLFMVEKTAVLISVD
jgi:hypothetical protein